MLHSSTYLSLLGIVPRAEPGGVKRANTTFCETQVYGEALALRAQRGWPFNASAIEGTVCQRVLGM